MFHSDFRWLELKNRPKAILGGGVRQGGVWARKCRLKYIINTSIYNKRLAFKRNLRHYYAPSQFGLLAALTFLGVLMLENLTALEARKSVSVPSKKEITVKELCQDEDIATLFRLVCQYDLRKKAIEALEKKIFDIKSV